MVRLGKGRRGGLDRRPLAPSLRLATTTKRPAAVAVAVTSNVSVVVDDARCVSGGVHGSGRRRRVDVCPRPWQPHL